MQQQDQSYKNINDSHLNQLQTYLHPSNGEHSRARRQHLSNKKDHEHWWQDQSKTQRRSYGNKDPERSISSREHTDFHLKFKPINNKSEVIAKEVSDARVVIDTLKNQNKQLKQKITSLQQALEKQESAFKALSKKNDLKETTSYQEITQLKNKLHQAETQLHEYLNQTNTHLTSLQNKQKEWLRTLSEKERTFSAEKKKLTIECQQKERMISRLKGEVKELRGLVKESQEIVDQLNDALCANQANLSRYKDQAANSQIELVNIRRELAEVQERFNESESTHKQMKYNKKQSLELALHNQQLQQTIAHQAETLSSLQKQLAALQSELTQKNTTLQSLHSQNRRNLSKIEELQSAQHKLQARITRYQSEAKQEQANSNTIGKQIKTVELQLTKIKLQAEYQNASRAKKLSEYEKINQLLNRKIELLAQENIELSQKHMHMTQKYNEKEDVNFEISRQLVIAKESLVVLEAEVQALRQQRDALEGRVKELEEKQQEAYRLRDQVEHGQRLIQGIQQREQLREIQLVNQIKLVCSKLQDKEQQLIVLKEQIESLEHQNLYLQSEVQSLTYSLKNLECELESTKSQSQTYRATSINFEQAMLSLQRTEANSLSSIEQLHTDNLNLKLMLKETEHAIANLGKRYDVLFKGTLVTLDRFYQILTQSKNIANQTVKHEKIQIANVLNDSLRFVSDQRKKFNENMAALQQELLEQRSKNSEQLKIINIKAHMIEKLEEEMVSLNGQKEGLFVKIQSLQGQIVRYQTQLKDKSNQIRQGQLNLQRVKKELRQEISLLEDTIKTKERQVDRLNEALTHTISKAKQAEIELQQKHTEQMQELNQKLSNYVAKIQALEANIKSDKEAHRMLKLKFNEQENIIAKMGQQQETLRQEIDKRTKELISVRVESDYRFKIITEKQGEINSLKKDTDRLQKERDNAEHRRKTLEEGNKVLMVSRNQLQATVKQKNSQILAMKSEFSQLELSKNRLAKIKEDLLGAKKNHEQTIRQLNQQLKIVKESLLISQQQINNFTLEKQQMEKDYTKKISIIKRQNQILQKKVQDLKTKSHSKPHISKDKLEGLQIDNIKVQRQTVDKEIEFCQDQDRKELLTYYANQFSNIVKATDGSRNKLLTIVNKKINTNLMNHMTTFMKELVGAINKLKLNILNRRNIQTDIKKGLLQEVKTVQSVGDKLAKCLSSDIY